MGKRVLRWLADLIRHGPPSNGPHWQIQLGLVVWWRTLVTAVVLLGSLLAVVTMFEAGVPVVISWVAGAIGMEIGLDFWRDGVVPDWHGKNE